MIASVSATARVPERTTTIAYRVFSIEKTERITTRSDRFAGPFGTCGHRTEKEREPLR
jgi:hypothetical protein